MKKGISLVALVITIIVLIILTGAVIINLVNENNIIEKANLAVSENNKNVRLEKYLLQKMDYGMNNGRMPSTEIDDIVNDIIETTEVDTDKLYIYTSPITNIDYLCYKANLVTDMEKTQLTDKEVNLLLGDINFDQKITDEDCDIVDEYISGDRSFTQLEFKIADVDKDSDITTADISAINQIITKEFFDDRNIDNISNE